MEDTIRWSTAPHYDSRFLIADTTGTRLRYCETVSVADKTISYLELARRENLADFTALDWSRNDTNLVALGTTLGETNVLHLDAFAAEDAFLHSFPVKQQRECTAVAFNQGSLLATGLKKHRTDSSLNMYDIGPSNAGTEPFRRLASGDAISDVKFFADPPDTLLAGIHSKGLRMYDLRDPNPAGAAFVTTRQFHHLSIDPSDENYFASAGPPGEPVVSVWDRRALGSSSNGSFSGSIPSASVLDINDAVDGRTQGSIRSLRFSGTDRGRFAVLSKSGQLRLFHIGRHPSTSANEEYAPDDHTESHYMEPFFYLKRSNDLRFATQGKGRSKKDLMRTMAFDFAARSLAECDSIVSLRRDGAVEVVRISQATAVVQLSPLGDVTLQSQSRMCATTPFHDGTIAEDLLAIQAKVQERMRESSTSNRGGPTEDGMSPSDKTAMDEETFVAEEMADMTSRQRHEKLLSLGFPHVSLALQETLTVADIQRRRCEEGYLYDCAKNKEIVRNDPWLVGLWDVVSRLEDLASDFSAVPDSLDLSYAGIHSIWTGSVARIAKSRHGRHGGDAVSELATVLLEFQARGNHSDFEGVSTAFPRRRKLGLIICGWIFEERKLRTKCLEILDRGEPYKAMVVAFCHGRRNVAIDMIKIATRSRVVENSGLAAVIACDSVSKEQRSLCEWMAEDAKDPYLKALLTYFITGEWKSIADMAQLPLKYRVAVALQHLGDAALGDFLQATTEDVIKHGDIEGILLTGIGADSMDLFQNYIDNTSDLQTAVLVNAFGVPFLVDDDRWTAWKEIYFHNMQAWRMFVQRTRFNVQHSRRSAAQTPHKRVAPPPRQVTLRCIHCQRSIAKPDLQNGFAASHSKQQQSQPGQQAQQPATLPPLPVPRPAPSAAAAAGTICPRCSRHLPRCSLCMLWLGTPDPAYQVGAAGAATIADDELGMARFMNFCMECGHGYHANHGREWFAKHQSCPVPDCRCLCAVRR